MLPICVPIALSSGRLGSSQGLSHRKYWWGDPDPNEAYEVVPMKPEPHGPPGDWWTVTRNGIPDRHFSASRKPRPNATPPTRHAEPPFYGGIVLRLSPNE